MATLAPSTAKTDRLRRIASPIHTIVLLWAVAAMVSRGLMHGNELRSASRVHIYERTMPMEWLEFAFVLREFGGLARRSPWYLASVGHPSGTLYEAWA